MDTMRREMIWAGGLFVCVLVVAIGARAADSVRVEVESNAAESVVILLDDVSPGRLVPLPTTYSVKRRYPDGHPMNNALAGAAESCALEEQKEIYSSKLGTFGFRPGRGRQIADDLVTELVRDCTICSLRVRVTGGVEGGGGTFQADFSLYDGCPAAGLGGQEIPGTRLRFRDLADDANQFHDLILDFPDRGMCDDGTCPSGASCQVSLQNCMDGTCGDGSACDPNRPACGDGSECTDGTCGDGSACDPVAQDCADQSACVRSCDDGTACELICPDASECVRVDCVGDSCLVSQQNCAGGICADGSGCDPDAQDCADESVCEGAACLEDPLEIPPTVWLRLRFDTDAAAVVMGSPPTRGFSADAYDDPQAFCTAWFGGWPTFPHATMFAEILAPATCETHFLAYLAANPNRPAFLPSDIGPIPLPGGGTILPFTTPTTRLGDDIRLTVDHCILSAYELGMKGNIGEFAMQVDLRWPDINTIQTEATFIGRGERSAEVGHFTIDENVNISIGPNDQPIVMTWKSNKSNTGAMEVNITQAGTSLPTMFAFNVNPNTPGQWSLVVDGNFSPAVFYAAIFCRGDPPRGACCPDQPAMPGSDMTCFDDVPVTSCLGSRWQINSTCEQNFFNPPCGTHSCCMPDDNCDDLTLDDCVEECITDVDPIFCEPVCNGGPNHRQPCNPANGDADCAPDGICDPDTLCPGQRTCGLTGCQLNGVFTGRPCDLNNPNQGASDCMTCSGSGEYCRPRCADGLRRGRPCDDNTDCLGGTCDNGFDCPSGQTCNEGQACVHSNTECSLRCSRWGSGEFCNQDDQFCPNFTCFDAVGDCFEEEGEHVCFADIDCPPGQRCLSEFNICTGRVGCDNLDCCATVCAIRPECCDDSPGETWDISCVATALNLCTSPPGNDDCHSNAPNEGAFDVPLDNDSDGSPCTPAAATCSGSKIANNNFAGKVLSDPGFCCNERSVNVRGEGTIWFKFTAMHESARIHTCDTTGSVTTVNSLIQVFKALEHSDDGSDLDECNSLEVIGCNDDSGCGGNGENCPNGGCQADICVVGLHPGEIYYIMMAASQAINQGFYNLDIESPCPSGTEPPVGSICESAPENTLPDDPAGVPFDLTDAFLDCPPEPQLPAMTNDLWYFGRATCTGNLIVQTCGFDLGEPNPDTTLAVYRAVFVQGVFSCPPTELVGWNDDATISECAPASYVIVPTFGDFYFVRLGGKFGSEPSGTIRFSCEEDDCNLNGIPDVLEIDSGLAQDCNENGEPDACDIASGFSADCNCTEIPDECEIEVGQSVDCSQIPEPCDSGPFFCLFDCDPDVNQNGIPDCCDDGSGCSDTCVIEANACCEGTSCSLMTESECSGAGGLFFGLNSTCDIPDADGDGLRDECDGCPADSKKTEPGICGCGVDDTADSDGDGVPDCIDPTPGLPVFKLWVTEVYEVNPDGSYTPKCGLNCPTQGLPPGIAQVGDLINIEVTVEGWDASTDSGECNVDHEVCSVSAQNCGNSHCSGAVTDGICTADFNCFHPDTCDPDRCEKSPLLGAFQWTIDSSTYSNGGAGPGLAPAQLPCTENADCACAYTQGDPAEGFTDCADFAACCGFCTCSAATCDDNICSKEAGAYIDNSVIPGYLFSGHLSFETIDLSSLDYGWAGLSLDNPSGVPEELFKCSGGSQSICNVDADCLRCNVSPFTAKCSEDADCPAGVMCEQLGTCDLTAASPYYLGTLLLESTGDSCGMFTLDLVQDFAQGVPITTFLIDNIGSRLPTPIVVPLTIDVGGGEDCNDNGEPDGCETDCNLNGAPDDCDIDAGISRDCNNNRTPDECDIASGTSTDVFSVFPFLLGDGIPDECQFIAPEEVKRIRDAAR